MVIPVDFSQVNFKFTGTSVPRGAEMTFGIENGAGFTPAAIASAAATAWDLSGLDGRMMNTCAMTSVLVKNGPNETGASAEISVSIPGTGSQPPVPPNVAVLCRKRTSRGGRMGQGRFYFPSIAEVVVNGSGILDSADISAFNTALADFLTRLNSASIPMVLLHGDEVTEPNEVTSLTVDARVATQRRRLRK